MTASHPEVCQMRSEGPGDALGETVGERCDRQDAPRCCFEVAKAEA